jgi:hypothetical protein
LIYLFAKAEASGGLYVTTAGSLAAGTGAGRMRWMMWVVQEGCRYDRARKGAFTFYFPFSLENND